METAVNQRKLKCIPKFMVWKHGMCYWNQPIDPRNYDNDNSGISLTYAEKGLRFNTRECR